MKGFASILLFAGALPLCAQTPKPAPALIQRVGPSPNGTSLGVRVGDAPLVFTAQIFSGRSDGDADQQAAGALDALSAILEKSGSDAARVVRLTAYATNEAAGGAAFRAMAARFGATPVAFTLVRTRLPRTGAQVAFEAVSVATASAEKVAKTGLGAAVLPAGAKLFVSGQAEKGPDLGAAVRLTMAGLQRTLAHLRLTGDDVVQVKAFVRPMSDSAVAEREISASFGGAAPPIVLVEWQSDLFAEIELVVSAHGRPPIAGDTLAFSALPWLNKSPRYSHVVEVAAGTPLIFVGELGGDENGDARAQLKTAFERVGSALFESGGSYRTLVKATYYLGDAKARALLGDIRGVYFDPMRSPAASAIGVEAFGRTGRVFSLDVIAVPATK